MKKENTALEQLKTLLARRVHSEHELRRKLKNFKEEQVESALKIARDKKWLTDPKELALRFSEELNRKKKGWLFIQKALREKKLPPVPRREDQEEEKCRLLLTKKFSREIGNFSEGESPLEGEKPPAKKPTSQKTINKARRFLSYRGFESTTIEKMIKEYFFTPD